MSEDKKKQKEPIFTEKCQKCFQCASVVYNMRVLGYFDKESYTQRLDIVQKSI